MQVCTARSAPEAAVTVAALKAKPQRLGPTVDALISRCPRDTTLTHDNARRALRSDRALTSVTVSCPLIALDLHPAVPVWMDVHVVVDRVGYFLFLCILNFARVE